MEKFFQKFLLLVLVVGFPQKITCGSDSFYRFYQLYQLEGPIASLDETIRFKNKLQRAPDAPEIVKQFCHEKLRVQGLNPEQIQIKIIEKTWLAAFGQNYILFSNAASFELQNALKYPDLEVSTNTVKLYSIFLDHEIAHLKNNDGPTKILTAYAGASLFSLALSMSLMHIPRFRYLFENASKPVDEYTLPDSRITFPRFFVGLGAQLFALFLYSRYAQFQEKRADSYAIALSTDPDGLRYAADFLERNEDYLMYHLSEAKFEISAPFKSIFMIGLRRVFLTLYQTQKTDEDFHSWIKRQPLSYSLVRLFWDMEHPSGYSRAQTMRLAAEALKLPYASTGDVAVTT